MVIREARPTLFGARSKGRGSDAAIWASLVFILFAPGCQPSRGGWDLEALQGEYPAIAGLSGHRLADMIPFPSFEGDHVVLHACRFPAGVTIRVAGQGPGWPQAWARLAVNALERGGGGFELALREPDEREAGHRNDSDIQITSIGALDKAAPTGLADTLSVCDISPARAGRGAVRGMLLGSEIRIKRARVDWRGQRLDASAEEWVGALMHEIGHALGFAGHAAMGDSILVREESRLRGAGRRALAGEPWRDKTLEALYQLIPGQRLGTRELSAEARSIVLEIDELVKRGPYEFSQGVEIHASVGDRQARVEWLLSDGRRLSVRMMHWREELRSGAKITLLPDAPTRIALHEFSGRHDGPRLLVDCRFEGTCAGDQVAGFCRFAHCSQNNAESE